MKRILFLYLLLSSAGAFAQTDLDSIKAWEAGKAIADAAAQAAGQTTNPIYIAVSAAAPFVFGWIWHVTHLKKKNKK